MRRRPTRGSTLASEMSDPTSPNPDPVTRLPPNSGGYAPGEGRVDVYTWEWGPDQAHRPGLPWIGIFLLIFGGLLLLQQLFPEFEDLGSVLVLAIGLAFLVKWAIDRGTGSLYAGAIITALAAPGVINALGYDVDGLGTFCFGVAFLWPWSLERFFAPAPWRVIEVSPIGLAAFLSRAGDVLASEARWVGLPALLLGLGLAVLRRAAAR